jgi:conserved oligomeric Golgi complex subunit 2
MRWLNREVSACWLSSNALFFIALFQDAFEHSLAMLESHLSSVSNQIITILTKRCYEGLTPVRFIPSQFRAMVTKRMPTEPSYFVASILHPLKIFFALGTHDGPGASLREHFLKPYAEEVFDAVCQRYLQLFFLLSAPSHSQLDTRTTFRL